MSSSTDASRFIFALPYGSDFKTSSTRKLHIRQLNDVLHLSIQKGDLPRARRAWTILLQCKEYNWKAMWQIGLLLASEPGNRSVTDSGEESIGFLKKTMRQLPEQQEAILQELVLYLTAHERFREALDELQLYLPSFPYQDNPILHMYAGLICFHLANHLESEGNRESLLAQAKVHLDRSLTLNSEDLTAMAFMKEITLIQEGVQTAAFQEDLEPASDEDMELNDSTNGSPSKRQRFATTST